MATLAVLYKNGETKNELKFNGKAYVYTMIPIENGSTSDAKCFKAQLEEEFGENNEELLEAAAMLDFGEEDDIHEALNMLSEIETQ